MLQRQLLPAHNRHPDRVVRLPRASARRRVPPHPAGRVTLFSILVVQAVRIVAPFMTQRTAQRPCTTGVQGRWVIHVNVTACGPPPGDCRASASFDIVPQYIALVRKIPIGVASDPADLVCAVTLLVHSVCEATENLLVNALFIVGKVAPLEGDYNIEKAGFRLPGRRSMLGGIRPALPRRPGKPVLPKHSLFRGLRLAFASG